MDQYIISAGSKPEDLIPVCFAVHEMLNRLPVTARAQNSMGVCIEEGKVVDHEYTGPVLEQVLETNSLVRTTPKSGKYKGIPVIVAPVKDKKGDTIAALGVVDITGVFDIADLMEQRSAVTKQVCGSDPCPLPSEQTSSKR